MRTARTLLGYAPNLAVVAVLAGLGWWGHHTHWHVPTPDELWAGPATEAAASSPASPRLAPMPGREFPTVVFASADDVRRAGVETVPVAQQDVDDVIVANARVDYDHAHVARLSARTGGRVVRVFKGLGQRVTRGEVLALLDSSEVGQAKADYLQEAGVAAYKGQVFARLKATTSGVISERTLLDAEAAAKEADLRRFAAQQKLINLGINADLPEGVVLSPDEMAARLQFAGIPADVVARLEPRPRTANLIPLVAPFDGVVTHHEMVVGELERPDHPALTVADAGKVWVWLSVRKEDAGRLAIGQPVEFRTDRRNAIAAGRLAWVSTEIDAKTRTVQARADMDNPYQPSRPAAGVAAAGPGATVVPADAARETTVEQPRQLFANMFGTGRVLVTRVEDALLVPDAAVQTLETAPGVLRQLVFVASPDGLSFEPQAVTAGRSADGTTHVPGGLHPGDRVVANGSYALKSELVKNILSSSQ